MYLFDPLYVLIMGVSVLLSLGAQAWVTAAIRTQSNVSLRSRLTGAQIGATVLQQSGLRGVRLVETDGWLTDYYDPGSRTLHLSRATFEGCSVAAAGIAAHEAGHAIQQARRYWAMAARQRLVPVAKLGTQLGILLVVIGLAIGALGIAKIGVLVFAGFVAFTIVTLPVELDASRRACLALAQSGLLAPDELSGVARVLRAAAATYVAAALTAILQLLYFVLRVQGSRHRNA